MLPHVDPIVPAPDDPDPEPEGEWTVPGGVTEFRVVLIGGGTGGGSGWPGKNGGDAETYTDIEQTADMSAIWYGAEGGDGGAGGAGGSPGRVKVLLFKMLFLEQPIIGNWEKVVKEEQLLDSSKIPFLSSEEHWKMRIQAQLIRMLKLRH